MKKIIILLVICLMSIASVSTAKDSAPDKSLIKEIEVMEAILDNTLGENTKGGVAYILGDYNYVNPRGVYLNGYGVVFDVPYIPYDPNYEGPEDNPKEIYGTHGVSDTPYFGKKIADKDLIPGIKNAVREFYAKYVPSVWELKPDEKFTIVMNLAGVSAKFYRKENPFPMQIIASISMTDIESYRKNKISEEELGKRIHMNEVKSIDESESIFSKVIQTSFAKMKEKEGYAYQGDVVSFSIPGRGALFMLDPDIWVKSMHMMLNDMKEMRKSETTGEFDEMGNPVTNPAGIFYPKTEYTKYTLTAIDSLNDTKKYEEKLISLISKYGHTLSKVKDDEYVEIAMILNKAMISSRPISVQIISVKKSDIDDFSKGRIDFEGFKKKVSVVTY